MGMFLCFLFLKIQAKSEGDDQETDAGNVLRGTYTARTPPEKKKSSEKK